MKRSGPIVRRTRLEPGGQLKRSRMRRTPPPKRTESELAFRDYVVALPCILCGAAPPSEPHHVGVHGYGQKCSHWLLLPVCHACHCLAEHPAEFIKAYNALHPENRIVDLQAFGQEETARINREWGFILGSQGAATAPGMWSEVMF